MWRIVLPLLEFAVYCLLGLGAFALIAVIVCGLWECTTSRAHHRDESIVI